MAAHYIDISRQEIEQFLSFQGFKPIHVPGSDELVFGKRVDQNNHQLTLRIYTSVTNQQSRDVGEDAIRCTLFYRSSDGEKISILKGTKRVNRVENWRVNLQNRIDELTKQIKDCINICPKCNNV